MSGNNEMCMKIAPGSIACLVPPPPKNKSKIYRTPWCHLEKGHIGPCKCGDYYWENKND